MDTILEVGHKVFEQKLNDAIIECKSKLLTNEEWVEIIHSNKIIRGFQSNGKGVVNYIASNGVVVRVAHFNESPEGVQPTKAYATLSTDLETAITSASSALAINVNNSAPKTVIRLSTLLTYSFVS